MIHFDSWMTDQLFNNMLTLDMPTDVQVLSMSVHDFRFTPRHMERCDERHTPFKGKTIVYYSGGLESALAATMFYGKNVRYVNLTDVKEVWPGQLIEPMLIDLAHDACASTVVLGLEYGPSRELTGKFQGFHPTFLAERAANWNVNLIQPFIFMEKFDLFNRAEQLDLQFCSCDNAPGWCGSCFKCFQAETFYRCLETDSPIRIKPDMAVDRYVEEFARYYDTGVDPIMTDMHSFHAALRYNVSNAKTHEFPASALKRLWSNT